MNLVQGSNEWLEWRRQHIGSSDAAAVMGASEWMTPLELWQEKCGIKEFNHSSFVTRRGQEVEPIARGTYCIEHDLDFTPYTFESDDYPFMAASLDGFNFETGEILEIKNPSKEVMEAAKKGIVHDKYIWQLEHQQIVMDSKKTHFHCVTVEKDEQKRWKIVDKAVVIFEGCDKRKAQLIEAEKAFWKLVQDRTPPPLSARDVLERTEPDVVSIFEAMKVELQRVKATKQALKKYEATIAQLKAHLVEAMIHTKEQAAGVRIQMVMKKEIDEAMMTEAGVLPDLFKKDVVEYRVNLMEK